MPVDPTPGWGLGHAVGLTNEGTQCPNIGFDQQQVGELLDAVGLPAGGTSLEHLPAIEHGHASPELCEAIRGFQRVQAGLVDDARVDVNGPTWERLIKLGAPTAVPFGGVPLMLSATKLTVVELPRSASGLPSLTYTIKGPVATYRAPGIRIELSASGPLKVSWGSTYPIACQLSPDLAALEAAVASGAARTIGGAALNTLCHRLKVESQQAIAGMFSSVSLSVGLDGTPVLGGSIGDGTRFQSISADPIERSVTYSAVKSIVKSQPVLGGDVQISGSVTLTLKVTAEDPDGEASVVVLLVGLVVGGHIVMAAAGGLAAGLGAVGEAAAISKEVVVRVGPALLVP